MQRASIFLFGILSYCVFFATFLYLIAFVGNLQQTGLAEALPWLKASVPHGIDGGRATGSIPLAIAINLGLILLFGMQHSIMARLGFKAWLKRTLPASAERSVFVLFSSLVLILLFWQWRPLTGIVWAAESTAAQVVGWTAFGLGFLIVLLSTFMIDHFDLFGLKQTWSQLVQRPLTDPAFTTPLFYRFVRHPLYLGFLLAFWSAPVMTVGRLLFACGMTAYILIAIRFEERDLLAAHGNYARYREQVPMLIPRPGRSAKQDPAVT